MQGLLNAIDIVFIEFWEHIEIMNVNCEFLEDLEIGGIKLMKLSELLFQPFVFELPQVFHYGADCLANGDAGDVGKILQCL